MRDAIAVQTNMIAREAKKDMVQGWLNLSAEDLPAAVTRYGWAIEGDLVKIPINKENEAKTTVFRENVQFNRKHQDTRHGQPDTNSSQSSRASSREVTSRPFKRRLFAVFSISHTGFSLFGIFFGFDTTRTLCI